MDRLFLIEFLISKINIESSAVPIPSYEELGIRLHCGNFLDLEIFAQEFSDSLGRGFKPTNGEFNCELGKTYLFPYKTKDLVRELENNALEINLAISKKNVGSSTFTWRKEFIDMVQIFENIGVVKSVNYEGNFDMLDPSKRMVGSVYLFVKMSCLGEAVETYISLQGKHPVFMNPKTTTQFRCETYDFIGNKVNPISTIYNPPASVRLQSVTRLSWTDVLGDVNKGPGQEKLMEFLHMIRADVETRDDETVINLTLDKAKMFGTPGKKPTEKDSLLSMEGALTIERINRKLCTNKDCYGLNKFYNHGLGPKFRESGLGCYYAIAEPSTSFGMNNLFEKFSRFGPNPFYRRPKNPYQRFFPPASRYHGKQRIKDEDLCYCTPLPEPVPRELCCCCRLRGGAEKEQRKLCRRCQKYMKKCSDQYPYPLRLRGGGGGEGGGEGGGGMEDDTKVKTLESVMHDVFKIIINESCV